MAIGIGIGIGVSEIIGDAGFPTKFFEILAENGDFLIAESGTNPTYLITEQQ